MLSMFPSGWAGTGLLLLRVSLALFLVFPQAASSSHSSTPAWLQDGLLAVALLVCLGLLTSFACVLFCLGAIARLVLANQEMDALLLLVPPILTAAALALLGPGAYSLDARRSGRRVIVISDGNGSDDR